MAFFLEARESNTSKCGLSSHRRICSKNSCEELEIPSIAVMSHLAMSCHPGYHLCCRLFIHVHAPNFIFNLKLNVFLLDDWVFYLDEWESLKRLFYSFAVRKLYLIFVNCNFHIARRWKTAFVNLFMSCTHYILTTTTPQKSFNPLVIHFTIPTETFSLWSNTGSGCQYCLRD